MSITDIIPDWRQLLRNTVERGLINAQEFEFVGAVNEESGMTEDWDPFRIVWFELIGDASKLVGTNADDGQDREVAR